MNEAFFQYIIDNQPIFKEQYKSIEQHKIIMRRLTKWKYDTPFRKKLSYTDLERKIRAVSSANDDEIRLFLNNYL